MSPSPHTRGCSCLLFSQKRALAGQAWEGLGTQTGSSWLQSILSSVAGEAVYELGLSEPWQPSYPSRAFSQMTQWAGNATSHRAFVCNAWCSPAESLCWPRSRGKGSRGLQPSQPVNLLLKESKREGWGARAKQSLSGNMEEKWPELYSGQRIRNSLRA